MTDWRGTSQKPVEESADTPIAPAQPAASEGGTGMTVEEEVLRVVSAERFYQLHCECGRSWFSLDLPTFVTCPACRKVGMVSLSGPP